MRLDAKDKDGRPWHEAALHELGASRIAYEHDHLEVEPDIDLSNYQQVVEDHVPQISITKRQAMLQLIAINKLEAIASINDLAMKIEWEYPDHGVYQRRSRLFDFISQELQLSPKQMTQFFVDASKL